MKTFVRNHKNLAAVVGVVAFMVAWWLSASARGYLVARFDVARGHYEVQGFGLPAKWRPDYARLLRERYGIEHHTVAGCVVSDSLVSYVGAYNSVTKTAAQRKFGRDVFAECAVDARKAWEERKVAGTKAE
ncbi:hypothetical protein [Pedosphaera parvula]|uniref:Uncharacterized protein n=1 Tax=Pedosphaera parvula (strain Ellin514) TaxID=320771 RepID=B9XJN5_PEDPL|nr:hypothetical protein [Pedosphaera parvula]EEF59911.1 hypothetical protein Cflav_PD2715 [Pedosphaera parvula Ellin514]